MMSKRADKRRRVIKTIRTIIIIIIMIMLYSLVSCIDTHYTKDMMITNVDNTTVTAIDTQDNVWVFYADNVAIGQEITAVMYNNHTITMYDDEVVGVY